MPYLIDGHNLIGKMHGISLHDIDDEVLLIDILENYFRRTRKKATIFFDHGNLTSGPSNYPSAFLKIIFVRLPLSADQAIADSLTNLKGNAKNYTVVSSDRWVQAKATAAGSSVMSSEEFSLELFDQQKSSSHSEMKNENDIDYWMDLFQSDS